MAINGCMVFLWNSVVDEPHTLLILVEEELVAVDLSGDDWPTYDVPYMCSLHNSAITCVSHVMNVPDTLWTKLSDVGRQQTAACSQRVMNEIRLVFQFKFKNDKPHTHTHTHIVD